MLSFTAKINKKKHFLLQLPLKYNVKNPVLVLGVEIIICKYRYKYSYG